MKRSVLRSFLLIIDLYISLEKKLYVGNLPYSSTSDSLKELFSQAGTVEDSVVIADKFSGRSKGFGFVTMSSSDEAGKAIEMFNDYDMEGRKLKVSEARPPSERPQRRGGFGGGGGGRDYDRNNY